MVLRNDDKPDERIEGDATFCERCRNSMSLVRVATTVAEDGIHSRREYQCSGCAMTAVLRTERQIERIEHRPSASEPEN
jgi:hypothetical protein